MNIKLNIEDYKSYHEDYEQFLTNIEEPAIQNDIIDHLTPSQSYPEFFTDEEIDWLKGFAFSQCRYLRVNPNGTFFISGNFTRIFEKFKDKLETILPGCKESIVVKGNYFITPEQYGLHNDSIRKDEYTVNLNTVKEDDQKRKWVPWRNVIIPLMVSPQVESHIVFFKQRHVSWFTVYDHGADPSKYTKNYPATIDYSTIKFETCEGTQKIENNLIPYDKEHYQKYLSYTPYRRLTGLTVENTFEWKPKCPMVFDCYQLHATNQGINNLTWKTKMGLLLRFFRKVK